MWGHKGVLDLKNVEGCDIFIQFSERNDNIIKLIGTVRKLVKIR